MTFFFFQKKIDNRKQSGAGGGIEFIFNEIDNIVLEIVGKESPVILGLPVSESLEASTSQDTSDLNASDIGLHDTGIETEEHVEMISDPSTSKKRSKKRTNEDPLFELKKLKLELQVEFLKKDLYLKDLEIMKLENEVRINYEEA